MDVVTRAKKREELTQYIETTYPILNYTIEPDDLEGGAAAVFHHFFPNWDASKMHLKQFTDGLTNKLYKVVAVVDDTPRSGPEALRQKTALVRIYGAKTEIMIDRVQELRTLVCLSRVGLSSPLYGRFNNGICYGFVEGAPFTPDDMKGEDRFRQVAAKMAGFHAVDVFGDPVPSLFRTLRKWLEEIPESFEDPEKDARFKQQFSFQRCREELDFLEAQLSQVKTDIVFCHNDLLCGNILYQPPTAKNAEGVVSFIDYEYSSYNYRAYDIANHMCEMMGYTVDASKFPSKDFQLRWLEAYILGRKKVESTGSSSDNIVVTPEEVEELYQQVTRFSPAPSFHWGVWALVQARYSDLTNFDYLAYSAKLFDRYFQRKAEVYGSSSPQAEA